MKNLIVLVYLLFSISGNGQIDFVKHADLLLNAHRALEKNDTKKALFLYESAFKIHDDNSIAEYLNAATCAAKLKNEESCKKWIITSIQKEKAPKKSLLSFSDNEFYQNCLSSILPHYNSYLASFYKSIDNPMVYYQIQKLTNRDQFTRKLTDYDMGISEEQQETAFREYLKAQASKDTVALRKYQAIIFPKVEKVYKDYNLKIMRYTDSLNVAKLIDITKEHGWQEEGWILLWHQRGIYGQKNWVWDFFKPFIDKEIEKGKITPFFWAKFEDITSIYKTGKSIYGYHPGPVDAKTVNIRRKSIGLPELTAQEIENRNNRKGGGRVF
ncbi:hypothetical protein [Winogradskyella flava]|uniref:hypothetical protein n=1 Tax=Winogradskyella flava TaxID=1884876 RepID=UPI002492F041|nr:hypothetical protein [Winogradskyella flava]